MGKYVDRFMAARPYSFALSMASVLYGLCLSETPKILCGLCTILCALSMHAAINIADDYFDHKKGVDTNESVYQSFVDKTEYTSSSWHLKCFIMLTVVSIILGAYLVAHSDYFILIIGILSLATTYLYSGGRKPLANMAFGEFLSFFFFGPIACCGTYYVQLNHVNDAHLLNSISIGLLVSCVMLVNNIRDIDTDKLASKITISVKIGEKASKCLYIAFVIIAYMISTMLGNFIVLLSLPFAIVIIRMLLKRDKTHLQKVMEYTSMLTFIYALLLSIGA